jgi:ABC-2 type transport system ATP-binding protein
VAETTLRIEDLHRVFTRRGAQPFHALKGIDLRAEAGQVVSVLGPNGAGKTTMIRICATLLTPTSGRVEVAGYDVGRQTKSVRRSIGLVLGGDRGFYDRASAVENLRYFADLAGVPRRIATQRIESLLARFGLAERAKDRVAGYSRGMRQRLHIARALVSDPAVVLLDEPTIGLDPEAAVEIRTLIAELSASGKTVLLTTHYLHEAEALSNAFHVIVDGRVAVQGTSADIAKAAQVGQVTSLTVDALAPDMVERLYGHHAVRAVAGAEQRGAIGVAVTWYEGGTDEEFLARVLAPGRPRGWTTRPATLEEAYLAVVEHTGRGLPQPGTDRVLAQRAP